jgi:curved DNA-binding protein CbpA
MSGAANSGMSGRFNPYKTWLGLDVTGRKPNHYELLGLTPGAIDAGKVRESARECHAKVKRHQTDQNAELATQLLNEIIAAEWVLADPNRKAKYDVSLAESRMAQSDIPSPTASTASPPDKKPVSKDPEKVAKVHSVQLSIDAATGYGLKEPEEKGKQAGFDWNRGTQVEAEVKKKWHLFGYAVMASVAISSAIACFSLWMASNARFDPETKVTVPTRQLEFRAAESILSKDKMKDTASVQAPVTNSGDARVNKAVESKAPQGNSVESAAFRKAMDEAKDGFRKELEIMRNEHLDKYREARSRFNEAMSREIAKAMVSKDRMMADHLKHLTDEFTGRESINQLANPLRTILDDSAWKWDIPANKVKLNKDFSVNANWMGNRNGGRWYINADNSVTWWHHGHGWVTEMKFNATFTSHQSTVPSKKDLNRSGNRVN